MEVNLPMYSEADIRSIRRVGGEGLKSCWCLGKGIAKVGSRDGKEMEVHLGKTPFPVVALKEIVRLLLWHEFRPTGSP